ncbi:ERB1 protein, partial [Eolophus roseicapillus]|nr:ERB1 protein [Eolophus roseicapilla]
TSHNPIYTHKKGVNSYCGYNNSRNQGLGAADLETMSVSQPIWNNGTPKALPPDVFLICGDQAWQDIPSRPLGGPCYLGKLTLLAPSMRQLLNISRSRNKRSIGLALDCDDNVQLLSSTARTLLSIAFPGVVASNALCNLAHLACWTEKQANITTETLEQLLVDQDSLRHALLQNRAVIDFLLLAQGHGCEDFEGMCCMNLSDHSESIHKKLQWLKEHVNKIQQEEGLLDGWLKNLFGNLPGWVQGLLKEGIRIIIYIGIGLIIVCCTLS